mgnify:CR=1 FL=1|tara:strand:- start:1786 stop:2154 length:369 start_codon:yes stop_codon:yes gene_type:complete
MDYGKIEGKDTLWDGRQEKVIKRTPYMLTTSVGTFRMMANGSYQHTAMKNIKTDGQAIVNNEEWVTTSPLNSVDGCVLEMTWFGPGVMLFRVDDAVCRIIVTGDVIKHGQNVLEVEKLHKAA